MNIDERLDALTQSVELLVSMQKVNEENIAELAKTVQRHEQWQAKVERTVVAGIWAALKEWRNGEEHS